MKRILSLLAIIALLSGTFALPAAAAPDTTGYAAEVLRLVNAERKKAGLAELRGMAPLSSAAQKRAEEIAVTFDHKRPNGSGCFTVLGEYGVSSQARGENIAAGQTTPAQVMSGWMNSPGHRANILGDYDRLGVGVHVKNNTVYWSQMFIREGAGPSGSAPKWKTWPAWAQWLMRIFAFGWLWMR